MSSQARHCRGFSIVELLVVVSIIGTLAGLSLASSFQSKRREQVNAVAIGLAGWLEEVRRSALRGNACEVILSNGSVSGAAEVARLGGDPPPETCPTHATPYLLPQASRGASYTITAAPTSFHFTPRGTKFPATDVLITISMANNEPGRCIQLNGLLGNLEMGKSRDGSCELTKF
jgi:prepilin-type N-terminal cleavage/methylation domain-containing protein